MLRRPTRLCPLRRTKDILENYRCWWAKLSPSDRSKLIKSGAFRRDDPSDPTPLNSRSVVNGNHFDFQTNEEKSLNRQSNREGSFNPESCSETPTIDEVIRKESGVESSGLTESDLFSIRLKTILYFLLESLDKSRDRGMRLHADIIRIVLGEANPPSMTVLAKRHKLTKSAVSLKCRKMLNNLGLEPSRFMRPEDEVESMRLSHILKNKNKP